MIKEVPHWNWWIVSADGSNSGAELSSVTSFFKEGVAMPRNGSRRSGFMRRALLAVGVSLVILAARIVRGLGSVDADQEYDCAHPPHPPESGNQACEAQVGRAFLLPIVW